MSRTRTIYTPGGTVVGTFGIFCVVLVRRGERYGRDNCLVHDRDDPLVEIYDSRYARPGFTTIGQFVSGYYLSTIRTHSGGLALMGGMPEWTMTASEFEAMRVTVERVLCPL